MTSQDFTCHGKWTEEVKPSQTSSQDRYSRLSPTLSSLVDYNALASTVSDRSDRSDGGKTPATRLRHVLVLSAGPTLRQDDNSLGRRYTCLSYREKEDGTLVATVGPCTSSEKDSDTNQQRGTRDHYYQKQVSVEPDHLRFNITSSGPCLQALTGSGVRLTPATTTAGLSFILVLLLALM